MKASLPDEENIGDCDGLRSTTGALLKISKHPYPRIISQIKLMENTEPPVSSTTTRTWHDFLERMRQPSATEFVKTIKNFITTFSKTIPNPEKDSESIQEFFATMDAAFRAHPLWAGRTEDELENTSEGLEKYIMTKLFPRVFASHPEDIKIDNDLFTKSLLIQHFIEPHHLDIQQKYQNETSWLIAKKELQKINSYKAPRDKLSCILSCCKVISTSLFNASENPPGADDFLPVLIYVTIKANVAQLHSNLVYIQRFRNRLRLGGEAEYLFTNMLSVESFILNIDAKALSMDEIEFENNMESARVIVSGEYNGENVETRRVESENDMEAKLKEVPSVSDLENKGGTMIVMEEKVSEKFWNFPFLYSKVDDLSVGDVDELLNGYKQLVFKYVCLAKGLGVPVLPPPETGDGGGEAVGGVSVGGNGK
ncbi:unnamed protein product [Lactuca virosa]|uniref:VPS9 domain-containing protein n=1 Tax=Lactuca virosa TaxID=75947 RepID=A0AAU9P0E5_9ASTR|nr:unnamed protein product [Lactuca virosa]